MNSGIPFIKIADRVEVTVNFIADRVGGPPLVFKQQRVDNTANAADGMMCCASFTMRLPESQECHKTILSANVGNTAKSD
jgi:hypothetical protein